jgi:tRNA-2-methylthio-N6-dimethylallyladenosine synthase
MLYAKLILEICQAFAKLLRKCGEIDGLERVRFMSPHPRDFTDDVIEAMAANS